MVPNFTNGSLQASWKMTVNSLVSAAYITVGVAGAASEGDAADIKKMLDDCTRNRHLKEEMVENDDIDSDDSPKQHFVEMDGKKYQVCKVGEEFFVLESGCEL